MKKGGRKNSFISARLRKQIGSNYNTEGKELVETCSLRITLCNKNSCADVHY